MSNDIEVKEVIELIKALNLQQAALISCLEHLSAESGEQIIAQTTTDRRQHPHPQPTETATFKRKNHKDRLDMNHSESIKRVHHRKSTEEHHTRELVL